MSVSAQGGREQGFPQDKELSLGRALQEQELFASLVAVPVLVSPLRWHVQPGSQAPPVCFCMEHLMAEVPELGNSTFGLGMCEHQWNCGFFHKKCVFLVL